MMRVQGSILPLSALTTEELASAARRSVPCLRRAPCRCGRRNHLTGAGCCFTIVMSVSDLQPTTGSVGGRPGPFRRTRRGRGWLWRSGAPLDHLLPFEPDGLTVVTNGQDEYDEVLAFAADIESGTTEG
jgi:hypothetical protein